MTESHGIGWVFEAIGIIIFWVVIGGLGLRDLLDATPWFRSRHIPRGRNKEGKQSISD